jgi:hypothetical protein
MRPRRRPLRWPVCLFAGESDAGDRLLVVGVDPQRTSTRDRRRSGGARDPHQRPPPPSPSMRWSDVSVETASCPTATTKKRADRRGVMIIT